MPEFNRDINVRSQGVQDILGHVPHWMIRWGICLIGVLIILFLFLSWLIKYPDTVMGQVVITTQEPPIKLISKNSGEINRLLIANGQEVNAGDHIGSINSLLDAGARKYLRQFCKEVNESIHLNELATYAYRDTFLEFGMLQRTYSKLIRSIQECQRGMNPENSSYNVLMLQEQLQRKEGLLQVVKEQKKSSQSVFEIMSKKYNIQLSNNTETELSPTELLNMKQELLTAQNMVNALDREAIEMSIDMAELRLQLNGMEVEFARKQKASIQNVREAIVEIEASLKSWEMNYQFIAPIGGRLSYVNELNMNQFIESGKHVFTIIPNNESYLALMYVSAEGFGKLAIGQPVRIKLHKYPAAQFGYIKGSITEINPVASERGYRVKVSIPANLVSSYNRALTYSPEMTGTAEIITEDRRVIERVFNTNNYLSVN